MKPLPDNLMAYKKTKIFDETNVPKGLLKDHQTLEGVWGKINVLEGNLLYIIQSNPREEVSLDSSIMGVVEPQVLHFVKPMGRVKFYVEFYR